jgi:hypothetical protein
MMHLRCESASRKRYFGICPRNEAGLTATPTHAPTEDVGSTPAAKTPPPAPFPMGAANAAEPEPGRVLCISRAAAASQPHPPVMACPETSLVRSGGV